MKNNLKIGDTAPPFSTIDLWNNPAAIPPENQWIYLSFHRFAACPFCNLRTNELIRQYSAFKQMNIEVITVWPSDKQTLLKHAASQKPPILMVSDRKKDLYKAYGVTDSSLKGALRLMLHPKLIFQALKNKYNIEIDADPSLMPASFLINPEGKIQLVHYGRHYGDHPLIDTILKRVNS